MKAELLSYHRQREENRSLPGAPALNRRGWIEAQQERHRSVPGVKGKHAKLAGPQAESSRLECPGRDPTSGRTLPEHRKYLASRGTRLRPERVVVSVLSLAGWSREELKRLKRCLPLPWDSDGQRVALTKFGFSREDAEALANV